MSLASAGLILVMTVVTMSGWPLLTLGEGWHNNHHRYPAATRQGFYRGELDVSFMLIKMLRSSWAWQKI